MSDTWSVPAACSAAGTAMVSWLRMRTPPTSPVGRARPSAVQIPLLDGISAACSLGSLKSMPGVHRAKARFSSEPGSAKAAMRPAEFLRDLIKRNVSEIRAWRIDDSSG